MRIFGSLFVALALFAGSFPSAMGQSEERARIQELEARVSELEAENAQLKQTIEQLQGPATGNSQTIAAVNTAPEAAICADQLKTIGLAFRIFSVDHGDQLPFHLPAAKGGSREWVSTGADGFDANPARHFMTLSNMLVTPSHLVCPADGGKKAASTFSGLGPANNSYLLRTGPDVSESNPRSVLARCPIHNHDYLFDGTVEPASAKRK